MMEDWHADLAAVLAEGDVASEPGLLQAHAGDWSEAAKQPPACVLFPRTPQQVAQVLAVCSRHGRPVAVQGGLTGLAGGATPAHGEVALSLARLNRIEKFDAIGGTVTLQAGVVLEGLQQAVEAEGWCFPLDLGARGSCQLGGNAATNAGGNRVIRYGTMRELVLGLEVALPDGRLLSMLNTVEKNTTGPDLKHLFIGSEGVLGVITRLVLKLWPAPAASCTALCALPSFAAAAQLLREMRRAVPTLSAFELMWDGYLRTAMEVARLRAPFEAAAPLYALVETQGLDAAQCQQPLEEVLGRALESGLAADAVVAQSLDEARRLWAYRESVGEMLPLTQPHAAFDIGIPMSAMDGFVTALQGSLAARFPASRHLFFGHLGDGNLHVLSGPHTGHGDLHAVEALVYEAVARFRGCISAEHGIGIVKKPFLHHSRSAAELDLMRQLKTLLDPAGILNPGRIFDFS